jgi:hypothetical protein
LTTWSCFVLAFVRCTTYVCFLVTFILFMAHLMVSLPVQSYLGAAEYSDIFQAAHSIGHRTVT